FGINQAPAVTTWLAFGVQLLPIALIAWGNASMWNTWYKRLLGALVVLFAASSGEVWLNTINAQFYWNIAAFLLLLEDTRTLGTWRRWLYYLILAISTLTGAVSCFLLPMFILKALWERSRESALQAGIVGAGSLVQVWAWWSTRTGSLTLAARLGSLDFASLIVVIFNRTVVAPILGQSAAGISAEWLSALRAAGGANFSWLIAALTIGLLALLTALCWRQPRRNGLMVGSYLLVVMLSVATALVAPGDSKFLLVNPSSAIRYFYAPSVMLLLLLLANIDFLPTAKHRWQTWFCTVLLLFGLGTGTWHYQSDIDQFRADNWPQWSWEVARWRANPQHEILIWPPPWKMKLQK
ncbi:MAG: hypothetical protein LLG44_12180, partial [Chloroflexi bacterium]|nr:hypothetical protein [Chloroflexota bacterium]